MAPQLLCCLRHITRNRAIRQTNRPVRCRLEPERMLARLGARHHQPSLCRLYLHHLCLGCGVEPAGRHGRAGHVEAREWRRRSQLQVHCKVIVFVTFLSFGLLFHGSVFDFQIFFMQSFRFLGALGEGGRHVFAAYHASSRYILS